MIIFLAVREKTTVQSKQPSKTAPDHFNLLRRQCMLAMYTNYMPLRPNPSNKLDHFRAQTVAQAIRGAET